MHAQDRPQLHLSLSELGRLGSVLGSVTSAGREISSGSGLTTNLVWAHKDRLRPRSHAHVPPHAKPEAAERDFPLEPLCLSHSHLSLRGPGSLNTLGAHWHQDGN